MTLITDRDLLSTAMIGVCVEAGWLGGAIDGEDAPAPFEIATTEALAMLLARGVGIARPDAIADAIGLMGELADFEDESQLGALSGVLGNAYDGIVMVVGRSE